MILFHFIVVGVKKKTENLYQEVIKRVLNEVKKKGFTNNHVGPSWSPCDVCRVKFNFVGKMETRESDLAALGSKLGFTDLDPKTNKATSKKCATQRGFDGESTHDIMNREMAKLSEDTREQLCKVFMNDFLMFGYQSKWCDFRQIVQKYID